MAIGGCGFAILAEGFAPDEEVRFHSVYKKHELEKTLRASKEGVVYEVVHFRAKDRGTMTHTITGDSCVISLMHRVGKDALAVQ